MTPEVRRIMSAVAIGLGATLLMDLWNLFLKRVFGVASLDYCLLGRWLSHIPGGTLMHSNIRAASLLTHALFGVGLYACALGLRYVLG